MEAKTISLPLSIVSHSDLSRARRELKALDVWITQAQLRKPGSELKSLQKTSAALEDFAQLNKLNWLNQANRLDGLAFLDELFSKAPQVKISFASEPSAKFIQKIASWFRQNTHPLVLVNVGLEPAIAAGCTLKTDNHFHDFSLRQHFSEQHQLLINSLNIPQKDDIDKQ